MIFQIILNINKNPKIETSCFMKVTIVDKLFSDSQVAPSSPEKKSSSSLPSLEKSQGDVTKASKPLQPGLQPSLQPSQG